MTKKDQTLEDTIISNLTEKFKKGNISATAEYLWNSSASVKEWVSTGSILLDVALSNRKNGGVPVGRLTEIAGAEGAGKTLLASYILASTQKKGGVAIMIDTEHAASEEVMEAAGVDLNKLIHIQVGTVEDVFKSMETITESIRANDSDRLITIVWDSVAATSTLAEVEGDYSDRTVAMAARLISQGLRKYIPICSKYRVCLVFTNQLRTNIGVTFGDKYSTTGGKAIKYHSSIRLRVHNYQQIKDSASKELVGRVIKCEVKKNKVAPPRRTVFYNIRWGEKLGARIDELTTIIDEAERLGVFKKISAQKFEFTDSKGNTTEFTRKKFIDLAESDNTFFDEVKDSLCDAFIIKDAKISADVVKEATTENDDD